MRHNAVGRHAGPYARSHWRKRLPRLRGSARQQVRAFLCYLARRPLEGGAES